MDFTTGSPSQEALSQLIKSLIDFMILTPSCLPQMGEEKTVDES